MPATPPATRPAAIFQEHGYISALPALTPSEVSKTIACINSFCTSRPQDVQWAFDIKCNLLFDWVYRCIIHPTILQAVEQLLGGNFFATNSVFRIKAPGSSMQFGWHQDSARIQVDPCFVIVYLALTEQTVRNGCLEVIPGSHTEVRQFDTIANPDGQAQRLVARTRNVDETKSERLELAAGEMAIFSGNLVHRSGLNRSAQKRIALLTDYTASHARQHIGQGSGQLVRGRDLDNVIAHEPIPVGNCVDKDVLRRRKILNQYPENPLMGPLPEDGKIRFPDAPGF